MLEVDLNALDTALAAGEPLIDVREADEFAQVRVPGATLIPLSEFVSRGGEIPDAETVYIICAGVWFLPDRRIEAQMRS